MCSRQQAVLFAISLLSGTACAAKQLLVTEGDSAVLPCLLSPSFPPLNEITVAWQTKEEEKEKKDEGTTFVSGEEKPVEEGDQVLFYFAKGKEDSRHQSPTFINRTRLISDPLQAGIGLELLNVSMRDNNTTVQCVVSYVIGPKYYSHWLSNVTVLVKRKGDDDGEQSTAPPEDGEQSAAPSANSRMRFIAPFGIVLVLLVMMAVEFRKFKPALPNPNTGLPELLVLKVGDEDGGAERSKHEEQDSPLSPQNGQGGGEHHRENHV